MDYNSDHIDRHGKTRMWFRRGNRDFEDGDSACYMRLFIVHTVFGLVLHVVLMVVAIACAYAENANMFNIASCGSFFIISLITGIVYYLVWPFTLSGSVHRPALRITLYILGLSTIVTQFMSLYYCGADEKDTLFYVVASKFRCDSGSLLRYKNQCFGLDIVGDACGDNCCDSIIKNEISTQATIILGTSLTTGVATLIHYVVFLIGEHILECVF